MIALAALVVPLWLIIGAVLVLAAAAAADAWVVRAPVPVQRTASNTLSRGVASPLVVSVETRRRMRLRQPMTPGLAIEAVAGDRELRGQLLARRRGQHALAPVASASLGPVGLVRVHHPPGPHETVCVYPDLVAAQALIARLRRQLAGHPGGLARGPLGLGTDFEAVREYTPDDDIRQLNWRATARMGRPMSNQYRVERDRDVICLLDTGRLMSAPIEGRTILDAALDATVLLAMATDALGDRCGAIAFDRRIRRHVTPRHLGSRQLIEALFDLEPAAVDSDFELAFKLVGSSRRALVVVFTDLVDEAAARSLVEAVPMLARRHALVVASPSDLALQDAVARAPESAEQTAAAVVALDVLEARGAAALRLARRGAQVIEARPGSLAECCLDAYLKAKSRAAL